MFIEYGPWAHQASLPTKPGYSKREKYKITYVNLSSIYDNTACIFGSFQQCITGSFSLAALKS